MWIQRHDGSLVNIEMFHKINIAKTGNGYGVYAWRGDNRYIIFENYKEENQAEEAKMSIFCSMRKGDKAMTMPVGVFAN